MPYELSTSPLLIGAPTLVWYLAGGAIGLALILFLWLGNISLGASTGFESLCSLISEREYFAAQRQPENRWRFFFFAGLLIGGAVSAMGSDQGWHLITSLGHFDQWVSDSLLAKIGFGAIGGLFIGLGTRLADGCTSGHGIFGLSTLNPASLAATLTFMVSAIITTWLFVWVVGGLV